MVSWMANAVLELADHGFFYGVGVLDLGFVDAMGAWMTDRDQAGCFVGARVGRAERRRESTLIRGDRIYWLDPGDPCPANVAAWSLIESVRQQINRELFAGLRDFEGHLAIYPPGEGYQKHVDTFRDDDARSITLIAYLNESWNAELGGQLRFYHGAGQSRDYLPMPGSIILFDSRRFPHEVLPARAERRSLTGWYRVRTGSLP